MLLLPLHFIKDAAKSVKRVCLDHFKKAEGSLLTELLGISALIVTVYNITREGEHDVLHLWCNHRHDIALCPDCATASDSIHSERHRCVRHLDIWGKKTFLHFLSRRFKCENCDQVFNEQLPFIEEYRRQTNALELHVYESCLSSNRKKVAKQIGLSQSTVKDIFNRSKDTLIKWLSKLTDQQRKAIKYVSIDMWTPYKEAVVKELPNAKLVVDRFHVMKHLNERISQIRRKIHRDTTDEAIKTALKGSRWILVRNRVDLSIKETTKLNEILKLCPEIRTIYLLKEEYRLIFEKIESRDKAERFLSAWRLKAMSTANPFLIRFVKTLTNWWQYILNYFFEKITNGFVEGLNGAIRNIIRRAFGYRNFRNFKLQVFAEQGFHNNPR